MARNKNYELYAYYKERYKDYHGYYPKGNIHRNSWMIGEILDDIGEEETRKAIEYYFLFYSNHDFKDFCYSYDEVIENGERKQADREKRRIWRARARKKLEELKDEDE